ncbi:Protein SUPPRESSOR OF GENE SILENCING 3 [Euphorbia peplus]|nr:Protein SUPPRESSOR OF GENE SILENCING 3 [Euphorbia peplus]
MALSSSSSSSNHHLLPFAHTHFFNELDDEFELQEFLDTTFAEQLQLEEALNASLFAAQMTGDSSLSFCDLCNERKEDGELSKSGSKCDHSLCLECSNLKKGNCPVLNCDCAPKPDKFKQFLPEDLLFLWDKLPQPSSDPFPKFNCREESHAKTDSRNPRPIVKMDAKSTRVVIPRRQYNRAITSGVSNNTMDRRRDNKGPKQVYRSVNKTPPLVISSGLREDECLAFPATDAYVDDSSNSTSSNPAVKPCPKWKGLREDKKDHEIVWPPMVVISYTLCSMDENDKWIRMMNQEVIDMFSSYAAIVNAQQCYNVETRCGMSMLIFESSLIGYLEAERLHNHFVAEGADRNAWYSQSCDFSSNREQQLYGYSALKGDVDMFNYHTAGKNRLKYEMRSYQQMVVNRIKQMCEDDHQLLMLRNRVAEQEKQAKESEHSYGILKEKLQIAKKELNVMRRKVEEQHHQHMEEVECQEQFYKDQIRNILESRKEKEGDLNKAQDQENLEHFPNGILHTGKDHEYISEEITKPMKNQGKDKEKGRNITRARCMLQDIVRERVRLGLL